MIKTSELNPMFELRYLLMFLALDKMLESSRDATLSVSLRKMGHEKVEPKKELLEKLYMELHKMVIQLGLNMATAIIDNSEGGNE